ncbi:MAG TPA: hypothetical protein VFK78_07300 [Gemmatimonadales bacterium]|nr:hypothetical protein [Gemmatimonadales bacterium]
MALTLKRWIAIAALAAAVVTAALLPPPGQATAGRRVLRPVSSATNDVERAKFSTGQALVLLRRRDSILALLRSPSRGDGPLLIVHPAVDAEQTRRFRADLDAAWDSLQPRSPEIRVAVVFQGEANRDWRLRFDSPWYLLPSATDGRTCVAVLPRDARPGYGPRGGAAFVRAELGPCAFYAAFGRPGSEVESWLLAGQFTLGAEGDWNARRPQTAWDADLFSGIGAIEALNARATEGLPPDAQACAWGERDACAQVLHRPYQYLPVPPRLLRRGYALVQKSRWYWSGYNDTYWYLADLVRDLGPERFAKFWRSPLSPESAFASAAGMPMDEWTHRWLRARHPGMRLGASASLGASLWGLLAAALALAAGGAIATRRRVA